MKTIELKYLRSTKGTHVYTNNDDDTCVTTVYVKRHGVEGDPAKAVVKVTVEE